MMSLIWPEGSVGVEEEVVMAVGQVNRGAQIPHGHTPGNTRGIHRTGYSPVSLDHGLTSLQWLQGFSTRNAAAAWAGPRHPFSPLTGGPASMVTSVTPEKPPAAAYAQQSLPRIVAHGHCPGDVDYKSNAIKPPYSYDTLICMAMEDSMDTKITLSAIYKYIADNFCFYRRADPTWQKSIRHNLSVNKCFIKVRRQRNERGKGGYWMVDPQYAERLLSSGYKNRQMPRVQVNPALQNRLQDNLPPPSRSPCTPMGAQTSLYSNPDSECLLWGFEEAMRADQNWDPNLAEGTMPGSWPMVQGQKGLKRKQPLLSLNKAKAPRWSSSPLLSVDEQEHEPLMGDLHWDALVESAVNRELGLEGGELGLEGGELLISSIDAGTLDLDLLESQTDNDLPDIDEGTLLAMAVLEGLWPKDKEQGQEMDKNHLGEGQLFNNLTL